SIAIVISVGLNAIVSPILGALSDRGGRRLPFLFFFTAMCIVASGLIAIGSPALGVLFFIVANFAYQAGLIYYDATLRLVSLPASFGCGALVDRWGPKRTLITVLASWAVGLVIGGISLGIPGAVGLGMFLVAGAILGSGLGGVQVADRVFMMRLAPPAQLGEF